MTDSEPSRYIPYTVPEVIDLCADLFDGTQKANFRRFARLLHAWYHHSFHDEAGSLAAHFNVASATFARELDEVVRDANFEAVTKTDLASALQEESMFQLRVTVDFNDFEEVVFYRRGPSTRTAERKRWLGLKREQIEFTNYDLVLVYVRFRPTAEEPGGRTLLKLFKNVPKADLEMLFPNSKIKMRNLDKLLIGVPALFSGVAVLTTKIGGTLVLLGGAIGFWLGFGDPVTLDQSALLALLTGAAALGGYLWKQYSNFKNRKIRFMKTLTENLYFKTVADDEGVISYLIEEAELAETKEALLAYAVLVHRGPANAERIAQRVERLLARRTTFDIEDALEKLLDLELVQRDGDTFKPLRLEDAFATVDARWDELFQADMLEKPMR